MSVSFTDESEDAMRGKGYLVEPSEIGKVYYPSEGVDADEVIRILYERKPWLEAFRVEGLRPYVAKRKGPGTMEREEFVALAREFYDVPRADGESYAEYFGAMSRDFCTRIERCADDQKGSKARRASANFLGFVENMWREGDAWTEQLLKTGILPVIYRNEAAWRMLGKVASADFKEYLDSL